MALWKKNQTAQAAAASVANEDGSHDHDDLGAEIDGLEALAEQDTAMRAAEALEGYTLTPGAKSLLDRAVDSLVQNDGSSIDDPDFKASVQVRAALLDASGNDLSVAIGCIVDACRDDAKAISGLVYSLCYNVLKQSVFFANLDYRRYLDPRADFDLTPYMNPRVEDEALGHEFAADQREEQREAPPGLDNTIDREWEYFKGVYGTAVEVTEDIFAAALTDLRVYLQLTTESFGWDADRPMPYANVAEKDGTFTPITDASTALDHTEVQRKVRRKERAAKDNARLMAAAEKAKAALLASARRQ